MQGIYLDGFDLCDALYGPRSSLHLHGTSWQSFCELLSETPALQKGEVFYNHHFGSVRLTFVPWECFMVGTRLLVLSFEVAPFVRKTVLEVTKLDPTTICGHVLAPGWNAGDFEMFANTSTTLFMRYEGDLLGLPYYRWRDFDRIMLLARDFFVLMQYWVYLNNYTQVTKWPPNRALGYYLAAFEYESVDDGTLAERVLAIAQNRVLRIPIDERAAFACSLCRLLHLLQQDIIANSSGASDVESHWIPPRRLKEALKRNYSKLL